MGTFGSHLLVFDFRRLASEIEKLSSASVKTDNVLDLHKFSTFMRAVFLFWTLLIFFIEISLQKCLSVRPHSHAKITWYVISSCIITLTMYIFVVLYRFREFMTRHMHIFPNKIIAYRVLRVNNYLIIVYNFLNFNHQTSKFVNQTLTNDHQTTLSCVKNRIFIS